MNKVEGATEIEEFITKKPHRPKKHLPVPREEADEIIGPNILKKPKLDLQEVILENLPFGELYERSLMHKENITIVVQSQQYIITISVDGHIKFWKKNFRLIDFVKHFRAHTGIITCAAVTSDRMATVSPADKTVKVFDILNNDLLDMIKLQFQPYSCEFVEMRNTKSQLLYISDVNSPDIHIFEDNKEAQVIRIHTSPLKYMKFFAPFNFILSIDATSRIEIWDPETQDFPKNTLKYTSKLDTDLYEFVKSKSAIQGITLSNNRNFFAIFADKKLRLFNTMTGKIIHTFDETNEAASLKQNDSTHPEHAMLRIEPQDFERRLVIEKDIDKQPEQLKQLSMAFDETDTILIYCTFLGIKFVNFQGVLLRVLGKMESTQRFMRLCLYQGPAMKNTQNDQQHSSLNRKETDPTLYVSAHKSNKFYVFSKRMPEDIADKTNARDILNEPLNQIQQFLNQTQDNKKSLSGCQAVIQTTFGEIYINLFNNEAPKTVENFVQHSKNGYYDNMTFHRVQAGFMIQTGCPKGNGTGGESIWGGEFQDEFHPDLRHDKPFTVSMANAGPNTNASQFFITVAQCPWLDDKHTIFGRVYKGMDVAMQISEQETDDFDKPMSDIKIITIRIL